MSYQEHIVQHMCPTHVLYNESVPGRIVVVVVVVVVVAAAAADVVVVVAAATAFGVNPSTPTSTWASRGCVEYAFTK